MRDNKGFRKAKNKPSAQVSVADARPAPSTLDIINNEILRTQIRKVIDEPKVPSLWERVFKSPLSSVLIGFLLTGVIGAIISYHFNEKLKMLELERNAEQRKSERERDERLKELEAQRTDYQQKLEHEREDHRKELEYQREAQQRELARVRSFSDELSQIRIQKIGEVWERVYLYEAAYQDELEFIYKSPFRVITDETVEEYLNTGKYDKTREGNTPEDAVKAYASLWKARQGLNQELIKTLNKNRFWIGDEGYFGIQKYIEASENYIFNVSYRQTQSPKSLRTLDRKRLELRANIIKIRDSLLEQ